MQQMQLDEMNPDGGKKKQNATHLTRGNLAKLASYMKTCTKEKQLSSV